MNRKWLRYLLFLCAGLVLPVRAQLQFTNVSNANLTNNLFGITCGGASNSIAGGSNYVFVAVGVNSSVVTWTFSNLVSGANQNLNWVSNRVAGANYLLDAAAFGGNQFLISGSNNVVFGSADAVNWTSSGTVFANSATAQGLAFNNGIFVTVASAPEIAYSSNATATIWGSATITNVSFADSFRGVTAFNLISSNSTNFAACGFFCHFVTSVDGGRHWASTYGGAIGWPDLFGITSDGRQTLVCVGANGVILTFTNGGTLWSSNSWGTSTLNAVSYVGTNYLGTNYGFMAVGTNGSVLISAEGTNWTSINTNDLTLKANTNNLNGVFFATSGQFKGVGVLVGDRGTIILAGTPPPPPVNPLGATNCASYSAPPHNNPLSVSVVTNANYPLGTVTVDWYDAPTGGILVSNNTTIYIPTDNPDMRGWNVSTNYSYYAEERDLRTGFTSTNRTPVTLTIYPRPTATVVTTNTICNGQSGLVQLQANLMGTGPWTVTWSDGVVQSTNAPLGNGATVVRGVQAQEVTNSLPDLPTNYTFAVTSVTNSDSCMGNQLGDITGTASITVNPLPSGVPVSNGNKTNCVGVANPPLTVTDTSSVIWYDTNGDVMASCTNSFTPTNSTAGVWTYYAAEVNASGCTNGNFIAVNLVLVPCTNLITSITSSGTNARISWSGNYVLQNTTNLMPPVTWMNLATGGVGANAWTNSMVPPPTYNFFRLYAPTN